MFTGENLRIRRGFHNYIRKIPLCAIEEEMDIILDDINYKFKNFSNHNLDRFKYRCFAYPKDIDGIMKAFDIVAKDRAIGLYFLRHMRCFDL